MITSTANPQVKYVRRLLTYAYGVPLDNGYDYFDGSCPECRRRFIYMERPDLPTRLKIQI